MYLIGKQIGLTAFVGVTWAKSLQPFLPSQIGPFSVNIFGLTFRDVLSINRYYKDAFLLKVKKQRVLALSIVKAVLYTKSIPPKVAFINKKLQIWQHKNNKTKKAVIPNETGVHVFCIGKSVKARLTVGKVSCSNYDKHFWKCDLIVSLTPEVHNKILWSYSFSLSKFRNREFPPYNSQSDSASR